VVELADAIPALRVLDSAGSDMSFPADHPAWLGLRYGSDAAVSEADVILVLDCDVPWIPTQCKPRDDAKIFYVDVDPLKERMPVFWYDAVERFRADSTSVVRQIVQQVNDRPLVDDNHDAARASRAEQHRSLIASINERARPQKDGSFGATHLCSVIRRVCPEDTLFAIEAVTNSVFVHDGLQPKLPGTWLNCGGGGLGWSGGAALGIKLAADAAAAKEGSGKKPFVVQIVGDGTYLYTVPGTTYWISRRYDIPILTIVLGNRGTFTTPDLPVEMRLANTHP
jgi:thiamine pyrophosphate-dependent acetolactate synthase large subunit-like protein